MNRWGFTSSLYNPCVFFHKEKAIRCLVHGDDFVVVGARNELGWMTERLRGRFEVKTSVVGGRPDLGDVSEARILNRVIRIIPSGWEYEAGQRHADLIIAELGVESMSSLTHPGGTIMSSQKKTTRSSLLDPRRQDSEESRPEPIISLLTVLMGDMLSRRFVEGWQSPKREIGESCKGYQDI